MARLRNPDAGTVVRVGEPLASAYAARGWVDADAEPAEAPKRRGRPPKNRAQ